MLIREPGCRACEQITSGDCGAHGPRVVLVSQYAPIPRIPQPPCPCRICVGVRFINDTSFGGP